MNKQSADSETPLFQIGAEGVDVEKLVDDIRAAVTEKTNAGIYSDARVARAESANLDYLKSDDEFLEVYLDSLREAVFVDISDFEIVERRARLGVLLVALKRVIWKLLKFYTYRLWSQQNQVNGLLLAAVESVDGRTRERIAELEARISQLETGPGAAREPTDDESDGN